MLPLLLLLFIIAFSSSVPNERTICQEKNLQYKKYVSLITNPKRSIPKNEISWMRKKIEKRKSRNQVQKKMGVSVEASVCLRLYLAAWALLQRSCVVDYSFLYLWKTSSIATGGSGQDGARTRWSPQGVWLPPQASAIACQSPQLFFFEPEGVVQAALVGHCSSKKVFPGKALPRPCNTLRTIGKLEDHSSCTIFSTKVLRCEWHTARFCTLADTHDLRPTTAQLSSIGIYRPTARREGKVSHWNLVSHKSLLQ